MFVSSSFAGFTHHDSRHPISLTASCNAHGPLNKDMFFLKVKEKVWVADRPLGLAELLHACKPLPEVAVLSETVVVGGQLEQFDLSDHLKLLQADSQEKLVLFFFLKKNPARTFSYDTLWSECQNNNI